MELATKVLEGIEWLKLKTGVDKDVAQLEFLCIAGGNIKQYSFGKTLGCF